MNMKILHLTLKKKWFDMIASGEKKEEYREIKPYWIARLVEKGYLKYSTCPTIDDLKMMYGSRHVFDSIVRDFDVVHFSHGYKRDRDGVEFPVDKITIGYGKPEWGAEEGKEYFVIKLGSIY